MNILIKNSRKLLVVTAMLFGVCATTGGVYAQQANDKNKASDKSTSGEKHKPSHSQSRKEDGKMILEVPVVVMIPMMVSKDLAMDKGCWVKLYDKKYLVGDSLLLVGPINMTNMIGPFGVDWENKVRSLETGPNASVTIFDNRDFKDEDKFIDSNKKVTDLSKKMGFFDNFRSLMLRCK